jgi:hypothetical protein
LGEDVEETGAAEVLVAGAGLEELPDEAGGLDEDDDEQPTNARVAKQASAAAHLVRELPNLTITVVPSNTIRALMPLCHYDDGDDVPVAYRRGRAGRRDVGEGATPGRRRLTLPGDSGARATWAWATRTPMNSREGNQRPFGRNELGSGGEVRGDLGGR